MISTALPLLLLISNAIDAFIVPTPTFERFDLGSDILPVTARPAIIYGADGTVAVVENDDADATLFSSAINDDKGGVSGDGSKFDDNANRLLTDQLGFELLTRVGCAFPPPEHINLHPSQVVSACVVSVEPFKVQIALGISDAGQLMQVLVPLRLPDSLANSSDIDMDEIMIFMQQLDRQAFEHVGSMEQQHNREAISRKQQIIQSLQEDPSGDELPDWWAFPGLSMSLSQECDSMKTLLNENDFQSDIQDLCRQRSLESNVKVYQARVASIGPSGIYARAYVEETRANGLAPSFATANVPIPFPKPVTSASDLRNAVLDLVESVEEGIQFDSASTIAVEMVEGNELPHSLSDSESLPVISGEVIEARQRALLAASLIMRATSTSIGNLEESVIEGLPNDISGARSDTFRRELLSERIHQDNKLKKIARQTRTEALHRSLLSTRIDMEVRARHGPRPTMDYDSIEDLGERAFAILQDLGMV